MAEFQYADVVRQTLPEREVAPTSESSIPTVEEFNGRPTILLNPGAKYPFSLGLGKCRQVLANMSFIQCFVDSEGKRVT